MNEPLYPFDHGLSYTEFDCGNLTVDVSGTLPDAVVNVSVDVANIRDREGE
jgi:beta-glucosidase